MHTNFSTMFTLPTKSCEMNRMHDKTQEKPQVIVYQHALSQQEYIA